MNTESLSILNIFMFILGGLSLVSGLGVVLSRKSLNSALCLVATMFLIAGQFALMRADFIATLQVMLYAGAIMILFVFVIMLLGVEKDAEKLSFSVPSYFSISFVFLFFGILFFGFRDGIITSAKSIVEGSYLDQLESTTEPINNFVTGTSSNPVLVPDLVVTPKSIGNSILVDQVVSFQAIGILLLASIVGAAFLAQTKKAPLLPGRGLKAMKEKHGSSTN